MSNVNPTPATLHVGQRVHHRSFGPGWVTQSAQGSPAVRVRFVDGHEPLVRRNDLLGVPEGFEPYFNYDGDLTDYCRLTVRDGFAVEQVMGLSGERHVWINPTDHEDFLSLDDIRELVSVLQDLLGTTEG